MEKQQPVTPVMMEGACVVVNRRSVIYEGMFDGAVIKFKPHERKMMPKNIGHALYAGSSLRMVAGSGMPTGYALGLEGETECRPLDGKLADTDPIEKLDRTDDSLLSETEPKALTADGVEDLGIGKTEKPADQRAKKEMQEKRAELMPADTMKPLAFTNPEAAHSSQADSDFTATFGGSRVMTKK